MKKEFLHRFQIAPLGFLQGKKFHGQLSIKMNLNQRLMDLFHSSIEIWVFISGVFNQNSAKSLFQERNYKKILIPKAYL